MVDYRKLCIFTIILFVIHHHIHNLTDLNIIENFVSINKQT